MKQIVGAASVPKNSEAPCTAAQRVASQCLCGLLTALPHFNYTSDVLQAVVANMISRYSTPVNTAVFTHRAVE